MTVAGKTIDRVLEPGRTTDRVLEPGETELLQVVEEQLRVGKRVVEGGRVVVRTLVEEREELAQAELLHEEVEVERVPVGRVVDGPVPVREEGGVTIVPVLEERMVVRTELFLKEEIRITKKTRTETFREPVRLMSQRAEVVRSEAPADGSPNTSEGDTSI